MDIHFEKVSQPETPFCPCMYCQSSKPSLYYNGYQITDSKVAYTIQSGIIILNTSNATYKDFGVYEFVTLLCGPRPSNTRCLAFYYISIYNYFGALFWLETYTVVKYGM